jgi:hypothetical protein
MNGRGPRGMKELRRVRQVRPTRSPPRVQRGVCALPTCAWGRQGTHWEESFGFVAVVSVNEFEEPPDEIGRERDLEC